MNLLMYLGEMILFMFFSVYFLGVAIQFSNISFFMIWFTAMNLFFIACLIMNERIFPSKGFK